MVSSNKMICEVSGIGCKRTSNCQKQEISDIAINWLQENADVRKI